MKTIMKWMLSTMLIASTTACNNEEPLSQDNTQGLKMTITALTPKEGSRVSITDNGTSGIALSWKSGDQISVMHYLDRPPGESLTYTFVDGSTGKFAGNQHTATGGTYYAAYPVNPDFLMPQLFYTNYAEQTGKLDENKMFMCAVSSELTPNTTLEFKHVSSILKPTFTFGGTDITSTLKTIQFTLPDDVYSMTCHDPSTAAYTNSNKGSSKFVKVIRDEADLSQSVYVHVPGGTMVAGDKIVVGALDINGKRYEGVVTFTKDIVAGKVYTGSVELEDFNEKYADVDLYIWKAETPVTSLLLGNGTDNDPYLIQNAQDLQYIAKYWIALGGKHARLEHDLAIDSNESAPWVSIGTMNSPYNGTFDGNNHKITGNIVCANTSWAGFFGNVSTSASIKNLTVDASVVGPSAPAEPITNKTNCIYLGGIAGYALGGTIENCTFEGNISHHDATDVLWAQVGGITGRMDSANGLLKNCTNKGTVTGKNTKELYAGGISGHFGNSVTMIGCINEGKVSGTGTPANIGTIAGLINNATICTCNKNLNAEGNAGVLDYNDGGNVVNEIVSGCTNQH